jgi:hypothetical protein
MEASSWRHIQLFIYLINFFAYWCLNSASCLVSKCTITWAMSYSFLILVYFTDRVLYFCQGLASDSILLPLSSA